MTGFGILLLIIGLIIIVIGLKRYFMGGGGPNIIIADPSAGPNAKNDIQRFLGIGPSKKPIVIGIIFFIFGLIFLCAGLSEEQVNSVNEQDSSIIQEK